MRPGPVTGDVKLDDLENIGADLGSLGISWDELASHVGSALRGKPISTIEVGQPRPLTESEIVLGAEVRATTKQPTGTAPAILKLRSRHHLIAQLLASGLKPNEVAVRTGYSVSRISILQADPMFKELLANYVGLSENISFDIKERLRVLGLDALDVLQHRLDEDPDDFEHKELLAVAELTLDRAGHGKSSVVQHQYGLDPE